MSFGPLLVVTLNIYEDMVNKLHASTVHSIGQPSVYEAARAADARASVGAWEGGSRLARLPPHVVNICGGRAPGRARRRIPRAQESSSPPVGATPARRPLAPDGQPRRATPTLGMQGKLGVTVTGLYSPHSPFFTFQFQLSLNWELAEELRSKLHAMKKAGGLVWRSAGMQRGGGGTGVPRDNPPTGGIVRHESRVRRFGPDPAGNRTRFALVGVELSGHHTTVSPVRTRRAAVNATARVLPPRRIGFDSRRGYSWIFARTNGAGRCRWLASFLGDLPFSPPLHSSAASYSPRLTLISSQDHDVKSHPNLPTKLFYEAGNKSRTPDPDPRLQEAYGLLGGGLNQRSDRGFVSSTKLVDRKRRYNKTNRPVNQETNGVRGTDEPRQSKGWINITGGELLQPTHSSLPSVAFQRDETRFNCLLASHQDDTGSIPGRVTPDFRMWESCRTIPLVGPQYLDVKSRPNLFALTLTQFCQQGGAIMSGRQVAYFIGGRRYVCSNLVLRAYDLCDLSYMHDRTALFCSRCMPQIRTRFKAVHDKVSTFEINLGKKPTWTDCCRVLPGCGLLVGLASAPPLVSAVRLKAYSAPVELLGYLFELPPPPPPPFIADFRKWESCRYIPLVGEFSRGSPVLSATQFRRRSIFTSITLIGSQDLAVKAAGYDGANCQTSFTFVYFFAWLLGPSSTESKGGLCDTLYARVR
ncbi:hypothetical protein PR048_000693 [Dryococelus australis]|uniref:Uncharacterized protein n=1 Tax=Dryococelus australis TaxID=614101 RepID=A0ABQ9IFD4_9NEOP|nr:hypothetical protein PR048_000693 [Dryococelus australis]